MLRAGTAGMAARGGRAHTAAAAMRGRDSLEKRVLRYPNGKVRVIRYPAREGEPVMAPSPEAAAADAPARPFEDVADAGDLFTVGALIRQQRALAARRALARDAAARCFDVAGGCPWPAPRPVWVLGAPPAESAGGGEDAPDVLVTFPTRVRQSAEEDALSAALGREGVLSSYAMGEAAVVFDDARLAARFADALSEERGGVHVSVCEMDSHALFRIVADAHGVTGCVVRASRVRELAVRDADDLADVLPPPEAFRLALLGDGGGGDDDMDGLAG